MEIVIATIGTMVTSLCSCMDASLGEQYKYMKSAKEEIGTLRNKKEELIAQVSDVNVRLRMAVEERGKIPTNQVQDWLDKANRVIVEVESVEDEAKVPKRCVKGVLVDCRSRLKLGKRILKLLEVVSDLLDKAARLSEESLVFLLSDVGLKISTTILIGKTTAEKNFEIVWEYLMGNEFWKIGVYGMGGVGKTTLIKNINNRLLEQKTHFGKVIYVTVPKDLNVNKLQISMANAVSLDLSAEEDETRRASLLLRALERKGKLVIILDDIWEAFPLHEIGIPEPTKENGCKLLLTSRSSEVCQRMGCVKVKVELLSTDEAWKLFIKTVGIELTPDVVEFAKGVLEECARLPLAVITIGGAMKGNDDIREWRVALNDLTEIENWTMDMEDLVIKRLRFSYSRLRDDVLKNCFLYCALYPEDSEIDPELLINYWVMEGLIKGKNKEDEFDRGNLILNKLERCCMLEYIRGDDHTKDHVKMHDLIRDMALHITRKSPRFMVKSGVGLVKILSEADWPKDLKRASFMENDIQDISVSPECPELLTLILSSNPLNSIAANFFVHMKGLTVLDLSDTKIEWLPESISELENLRALLLTLCRELKRIPSLSKVKSLRVLRLDSTAIEELPHGMEMLVNLKCLNLRWIRSLRETIPTGMLMKFSLLQELELRNMYEFNIGASRRGRGFVDELLSLTQLESLGVHFHDFFDFITYATLGKFKGLKEYNFVVGKAYMDLISEGRSVSICNSNGIPYDNLILPINTQILSIEEFHDITKLSEFAGIKEVMDLRECGIRQCDTLECILSSEDEHLEEEGIILNHLEVLIVEDCWGLSTLCRGVPTSCPFPCLKSIEVSGCDTMKNLLSSRLLRNLQNLEQIDVRACDEMEELITGEDNEEMGERSCISILPKFQNLKLFNLPKLKSIWNGVMVCDSLECVEIMRCSTLKRLPRFSQDDHQTPPPVLKTITGERVWWDAIEWDHPDAKFLW
ncbi:hypothetical protein AQUCO_05300109v1 [Aquilegia coerulea]|uniref:Uncharacterized protein n=1 Tax=Aquilegia coerulea TaxID=218851 RepID=A0A2G5CIE6_AQUCA|nr:hypothetical protein AQUCO_05300109v1 [Aquilegia coerulea]PIA31052.1 hypothetical protein AQUCO_05300109v1 [Aquilegia coerulea]PIA31053.1 hypothetical protein AQUCO_05300109v1 [Aquilegia coerulea]